MKMKDSASAIQDISLIIPIFNAEQTLDKCLESVLSQDYEGIEIILVDDGSTDTSSKIIDDYVERFSNLKRIKAIHKSNEGLIKARITGLEAATSDFIAFVDADDYIDKNHISTMLRDMGTSDADLVIEGCERHENGKTEILKNRFLEGVYDSEQIRNELFPSMLYSEGFFEFGLYPFMWNKLFRRDLLLECYKEIDPSVYDGEDVLTFFAYMMKVKKLVIGDAYTYHYCVTENSMTRNKRPDYLENVSRLYLNLSNIFSKSDRYDVLRPQLDRYMRMMVKNSALAEYIADEKFFFPFSKIQANSRVVVYAAGLVGKNYIHQIKETGYCELAAWVDQNYDKLESFEGVPVQTPKVIDDVDYDYIVLAVSDEDLADRIKNDLISRYGIDENKIVF